MKRCLLTALALFLGVSMYAQEKISARWGSADTPASECDPITTFPYVNDFENFLYNHDCWVSIDADGDGQDWITGLLGRGSWC